jgi:acylglycerol lipase
MTVRAAGSMQGLAGVALFLQSWLPDHGAPVRGTVVIVHGLGEHSDRYDHVAERLVDAGFAVYAGDHRGHGRSQGPRAMIETTAVVADVDQLVVRAATAQPDGPLFLLGHSLGGMIAVAYALAHGERLDGLILSGPLAAVDASRALAQVGRLLSAVAPRAPTLALDARLISRDR